MNSAYNNQPASNRHVKAANCLSLLLLFFVNFSQGRNNPIGHLFTYSDVFKWEGCEDVKPSDFVEVKLITAKDHKLKQPAKVCFNKTSDEPNFYFLERITGKIRYYTDATKTVSEVGQVTIHNGGTEDGLNGIALDYDFDTTRWMYLFYAVKGFFRIARYKITTANTMDMATEQILLEIPKKDGQWHASGAMDFDAYGNLYISIGDNLYGYYNTKRDKRANHYVSMATADLRGGFLRIHPTEKKQSNGKYYTIPKDNFGEYWAKIFDEEGRTELAKDYRDPSIVFPEIFAKGIRNSWTLKVVEPFRRFVASGECGPDHPSHGQYTEEANITNTPKFFGWPIQAGAVPTQPFKGKQLSTLPGGTIYDEKGPQIGANKYIKGAKTLPPIQSAVYHWEYLKESAPSGFSKSRSCGTGAEMYWYDGYNKSTRKFPPHFNGKFFVTDHDAQWIRVVTLNDALDKTLSESEFFAPNSQINTEKPLDVTFGPDGALYVIHWIGSWFNNNTKQNISRIEYKGTCLPEEPKSPFRGCMDPTAGNYDPRVKRGCPENECCKPSSVEKPDINKMFTIGQKPGILNVSITEQGPHSLSVSNVSGKLIASKDGRDARQYSFSNLKLGLYFISIELGNQKISRKVLVN